MLSPKVVGAFQEVGKVVGETDALVGKKSERYVLDFWDKSLTLERT